MARNYSLRGFHSNRSSMSHGVADKSQKPEFPTLYSPLPRANIAREWGTHSLKVRDKIHNGKQDGPPSHPLSGSLMQTPKREKMGHPPVEDYVGEFSVAPQSENQPSRPISELLDVLHSLSN